MQPIILNKEELDHLKELTREASNTPVIAMSSHDILTGRDWSSMAWDQVRYYWQELGRKYGFDPEEVKGINSTTGEVML